MTYELFEITAPAPAVSPIWELSSPLAIVWQTAAATLEAEASLAATHQKIKAQRQALDAQLIRLDGQKQSRLSPTQAVQRREEEAACATKRRAMEEHRMQVYTQLVAVNLARRQAEESYRLARAEAWSLLRAVHDSKRRAARLTSAVLADAAAQEALTVQQHLAEQVGTSGVCA